MGTMAERPPQVKHDFYFYGTGPGGGSTVIESLSPARMFELYDVRVALSTSHASAVQAALRLSSILGAAYNTTLFSFPIQGLSNYFWQPSVRLFMLSGDEVVLSLIVSAANVWSVYMAGSVWSVVES